MCFTLFHRVCTINLTGIVRQLAQIRCMTRRDSLLPVVKPMTCARRSERRKRFGVVLTDGILSHALPCS